MKLVVCPLFSFALLLSYIKYTETDWPVLSGKWLESAEKIIKLAFDVKHDTDQIMSKLEGVRQGSLKSPAYEIGYVTYVIQDKYRRMVDKYNSSYHVRQKFYTMELVLILEEVERHFWEIEHLANMLHEIEPKYGIKTNLTADYVEISTTRKRTKPTTTTKRTRRKTGTPRITTKRTNWRDMVSRLTTTMRKQTRWWWPLEYGWEIDYYW